MTIIHLLIFTQYMGNGEYEAQIAIETLQVIEGRLPRRALGLVLHWAELHRQELRDNWNSGEEHRPLVPIQPLE
jgi:hypothetical protein